MYLLNINSILVIFLKRCNKNQVKQHPDKNTTFNSRDCSCVMVTARDMSASLGAPPLRHPPAPRPGHCFLGGSTRWQSDGVPSATGLLPHPPPKLQQDNCLSSRGPRASPQGTGAAAGEGAEDLPLKIISQTMGCLLRGQQPHARSGLRRLSPPGGRAPTNPLAVKSNTENPLLPSPTIYCPQEVTHRDSHKCFKSQGATGKSLKYPCRLTL